MTSPKLPFTVKEYAFALGIDKGLEGFEGGFAGTLSPDGTFELSEEKMKGMKTLTTAMKIFPDIPPEQTMPFFEEVASRYLPTIVQVFRKLKPATMDFHSSAQTELLFRLALVESPFLIRYLREHPGSSPWLKDMMSSARSYLPSEEFFDASKKDRDTLEKNEFKIKLVHQSLVLYRLLLTYSPAGSTLVADRETGLYFAQVMSSLAINRFTMTEEAKRVLALARAEMTSIMYTITMDDFSFESAAVPRCRLSQTGECERGKELNICSRCRTVRYCSQKHQKQDWKSHRKIYFLATW